MSITLCPWKLLRFHSLSFHPSNENSCKMILFFFFFFTAEEGQAMAAIADKPVEVANFVKHCEQRRKYPVLLRVEFQVGRGSSISFIFHADSTLFSLSHRLYRRPVRWRASQPVMPASRRTDQRIKTKKSFLVSITFLYALCLRAMVCTHIYLAYVASLSCTLDCCIEMLLQL